MPLVVLFEGIFLLQVGKNLDIEIRWCRILIFQRSQNCRKEVQEATYLQETEEDHGLVQHRLDLCVGEAFDAFLQLVVDKEGEVLGRPLVEVQEELKVAGDRLFEEPVVVE